MDEDYSHLFEQTHTAQNVGSAAYACNQPSRGGATTFWWGPTVYHPGVNHGHAPCGRWSQIQSNPNSPGAPWYLIAACKILTPRMLVGRAIDNQFDDKPLALLHLKWYLDGNGADFPENENLAAMLQQDTGVQKKIAQAVPSGVTGGRWSGFFKLESLDYANSDFQFSFGAIDRLDLQVDFDAGFLHAWFQDRYEWHPYYPGLYDAQDGDAPARFTNCVHAACVELKSSGAADFWMKGEATVPLSCVLNS